MTESVARILSEVSELTGAEKAELAYAVVSTLGPVSEQTGDAWEAELSRRASEIQAGVVAGRPADEVFANLRNRRS